MTSFTIGLLGVSAGIAVTIWLIIGVTNIRLRKRSTAVVYLLLVLANLGLLLLVAGIIVERPFNVRIEVTIILLLIVVLVPPVLQLRSWTQARNIVQHARNNHE
jgi:L-asparagine transporter-like permease